jgi:hypothetical protein
MMMLAVRGESQFRLDVALSQSTVAAGAVSIIPASGLLVLISYDNEQGHLP